MDLQKFIEGTTGQIVVTLVLALVLIIGVVVSGRGKKFDTKALTYSALAVALAFLLNQVTLFKMPQGGSVTLCSMLVICLIGYFFGLRTGICAGVALGLLDLLINPYVISPIQMVLDYPLAYGMLGLTGLFSKKESYSNFLMGYGVSVFARFICSCVSGVVFFGSYAPAGMNPLVYSIVYNGSFMGAEMILTLVVLCIPAIKKVITFEKNKLYA